MTRMWLRSWYQGREHVFDIGGWFGGALVPIARLHAQGVSAEAAKFCIFEAEILQFDEYFQAKI